MTEGLLWPLVHANLLASLRNPMALIYGWLFPLLFLVALSFWTVKNFVMSLGV